MNLKKAYFLIFLSLGIVLSCSTEEDPEEISENGNQIELPVFSNISVDEISTSSAMINVIIIDGEGSKITESGIYWSENSNPTISDNSVMSGDGSENFEIRLEDLESNTNYYVRAFAKNEAGISYSEEKRFKTLEEDDPGTSGIILRTTNGGSTWESIRVDNIMNLHSVIFLDKDTGYAVGDLGKIIKTEDGGKNWMIQNIGSYILNDVFFINKNEGYAVGNHSKILKTEDGGGIWFEQESGTNKELRSIYFTDESTGFIVGSGGVILKTENAGEDWTMVDQDPYRKSLYAVEFSDPYNGYAAGYEKIYNTTDGGLTWNSQLSSSFPLSDLYIVPDGPTYAVSMHGFVYKINNGDTEWKIIAEYLTYDLETVFFIDSDTGYIAGFDGDIFKTTDGGENWILQETGTIHQIDSIFFTDENRGIAVGFMK